MNQKKKKKEKGNSLWVWREIDLLSLAKLNRLVLNEKPTRVFNFQSTQISVETKETFVQDLRSERVCIDSRSKGQMIWAGLQAHLTYYLIVTQPTKDDKTHLSFKSILIILPHYKVL